MHSIKIKSPVTTRGRGTFEVLEICTTVRSTAKEKERESIFLNCRYYPHDCIENGEPWWIHKCNLNSPLNQQHSMNNNRIICNITDCNAGGQLPVCLGGAKGGTLDCFVVPAITLLRIHTGICAPTLVVWSLWGFPECVRLNSWTA